MHLSPGLRVGPYEVRELRGSGATGEVWLARDTRLGRDVALKVLRPDAPAGGAALLEEARAASALSHPAVATIYEAGEAAVEGKALAYIAMELVDGPTLGEHARAGASCRRRSARSSPTTCRRRRVTTSSAPRDRCPWP